MLLVNFGGLRSNKDKLETQIVKADLKPDVIIITQSKLDSVIADSDRNFNMMLLTDKTRQGRRHRIIYYKSNIPVKRMINLERPDYEMTIVSVKLKSVSTLETSRQRQL